MRILTAGWLASAALIPQPIAAGEGNSVSITGDRFANSELAHAYAMLLNLTPLDPRYKGSYFMPRPKKFVDAQGNTTIEFWDIQRIRPGEDDPHYVDGAALPGSSLNASIPSDIAADTNGGLIVVGSSQSADGDNDPNTVGPYHAFRWTETGGIVDLGALSGPTGSSFASGISSDATTIVGESSTAPNIRHAFRIGSDNVMRDLGSIEGPNGLSRANAVNADGSVVVGDTTIAFANTRAFRWVQTPGQQTGTMTNLGTLGFDSQATAVSGDGSVVVGNSTLLVGGVFEQHAFRWAQNTGLVDIGVLPGQVAATATGVSDNGKVVVGFSDPVKANRDNFGYSYSDGNDQTRAFRWTEATGMVDLQQLLIDHGQDLTGIQIYTAGAVSEDGRYIIGEAHFDSLDPDPTVVAAYFLCYADDATEGGPCPTGGITTQTSVDSSLTGVQGSHAGVINHLGATADLLLGSTDPMTGGDEATSLAAFGSFTLGIKGRYTFDSGLTLVGGFGYADMDVAGLKVGGAIIAASGLRYVWNDKPYKPFVEVGGWFTPQANLTISRTYANGAGTATGTGTTTGSIGGLYAKGGVILNPTTKDEIALSATIAQNWLSLAGYTESPTNNPFPATFSAANDTTTSVKATVAWTHEINEKIDMTLSASVGELFGIDPVNATVAGLGAVTSPGGNATFGEIGARLGYKVSDTMTLNGFAAASFGSTGGTHLQVGLGVSLKF